MTREAISNQIVYMLDDKCPTCQEPDKSELGNARKLCSYEQRNGHAVKVCVLLGGNTQYQYLLGLAAQEYPEGIDFPVFYYNNRWYRHADDLIPDILDRSNIE